MSWHYVYAKWCLSSVKLPSISSLRPCDRYFGEEIYVTELCSDLLVIFWEPTNQPGVLFVEVLLGIIEIEAKSKVGETWETVCNLCSFYHFMYLLSTVRILNQHIVIFIVRLEDPFLSQPISSLFCGFAAYVGWKQTTWWLINSVIVCLCVHPSTHTHTYTYPHFHKQQQQSLDASWTLTALWYLATLFLKQTSAHNPLWMAVPQTVFVNVRVCESVCLPRQQQLCQ